MTLDEALTARFAGIRVVGDVHGEAELFAAALREAEVANLFTIQLGDLVDRGPDSPGALRLALDLRDRGAGLTIRGNHDDKLFRALSGNKVQVGADLAKTIGALRAAPDGDGLVRRFLGGYPLSPWWVRFGSALCVHGAFHRAMLDAPSPDEIAPRRVSDKCRWLALYGEGRIGQGDDLPTRTYAWIDDVPKGLTVFIGHDVVAVDRIVERTGKRGGSVIFCDTGCGKGGKLGWVDLNGPGLKRQVASFSSDNRPR